MLNPNHRSVAVPFLLPQEKVFLAYPFSTPFKSILVLSHGPERADEFLIPFVHLFGFDEKGATEEVSLCGFHHHRSATEVRALGDEEREHWPHCEGCLGRLSVLRLASAPPAILGADLRTLLAERAPRASLGIDLQGIGHLWGVFPSDPRSILCDKSHQEMRPFTAKTVDKVPREQLVCGACTEHAFLGLEPRHQRGYDNAQSLTQDLILADLFRVSLITLQKRHVGFRRGLSAPLLFCKESVENARSIDYHSFADRSANQMLPITCSECAEALHQMYRAERLSLTVALAFAEARHDAGAMTILERMMHLSPSTAPSASKEDA